MAFKTQIFTRELKLWIFVEIHGYKICPVLFSIFSIKYSLNLDVFWLVGFWTVKNGSSGMNVNILKWTTFDDFIGGSINVHSL